MTGDPEHFRKFEKLEEKLSSMKVEGCHIELHSENTVCCRTFGGHCIYSPGDLTLQKEYSWGQCPQTYNILWQNV